MIKKLKGEEMKLVLRDLLFPLLMGIWVVTIIFIPKLFGLSYWWFFLSAPVGFWLFCRIWKRLGNQQAEKDSQ